MKFHETLKKARMESRYPHVRDFADRVGLSYGGYKKMESGERIPEADTLETIIRLGELSTEWSETLRALRMQTHAKRSGLPAIKAVDVDQLVSRLETEFIVLVKPHVNDVRKLASLFNNRAAVILKAALED